VTYPAQPDQFRQPFPFQPNMEMGDTQPQAATPQQYPPAGQEYLTSSPTDPQPITQRPGWGTPPEPPKRSKGKTPKFGWRGIIIAAVIGFLVGLAFGQVQTEPETGAFTQGTGYHSTEPSALSREGGQETTDRSTTSPDRAPAEEPHTAPPKPKLTKHQEQAIGSARDYLDGQHFSRSGLIHQLKYEGHSGKDAKFAVDYLHVDWNKQAAGTAKDYLDGQHFSRSGLIHQLKYEGYTQAQAEYGVKRAGL
jgi:hypothetical protein